MAGYFSVLFPGFVQVLGVFVLPSKFTRCAYTENGSERAICRARLPPLIVPRDLLSDVAAPIVCACGRGSVDGNVIETS